MLTLKSRPKEVQFWWPVPLAVIIWVIIIWAFGFLFASSEGETETPQPIEASFVELPEEKPAQKALPVPRESAKTPTPVKSQPQPKPPPQPRLGAEKAEPVKRLAEKGTAKSEARADSSSAAKTAPDSAQPKDMLAYMNEARERRRAGGIFEDEPKEPEAVEREPSAEELRMANVMRNLKEPGASGIFQIIRMGPRNAQFLFRAWKKDSSVPRRELIEVNAGPGVDIQRAVVRKMIELIREYHKEEFNWDSYRLDRVVVLSSRLEDSKGLEDFLIREFFGDSEAPVQRR